MKSNQKLIDMTQKFLDEFLRVAHEIDKEEDRKSSNLYHFNFTLADAIGACKFPEYDRDEQTTILMGMSSFDDSIAKAFFNRRIQGFIKIIEEKLASTHEQDDYYIKNIKSKTFLVDDFDLELIKTADGTNSIKTIPCKREAEDISFDVLNSRSGFSGKVIIHKKKEISKVMIKNVDFIKDGQRVMTISYKMDEHGKFYEKGEFTHYRHIADINSFFLTISNV